MTSWHSGDGGRDGDFLSHGDDHTPLRPVRLFAAAAFLLVLGAALGTRIEEALTWLGWSRSTPELTGGTFTAADRPEDRLRFRVDLFNAGEETVRARVVDVLGRWAPVTRSRPVALAPHSWGTLAFSLPTLCDEPALPDVTTVRVRATVTTGSSEQRVGLSAPATVLRTVHERECRPAEALTRQRLGGLWLLEEDQGRSSELAGVGLMRFTGDGRFTLDPEGPLFHEGHRGFFGSYRLRGTRLELQGDAGYPCTKDRREVWTTTPLDENLLRLDIVRSDSGHCSSPPYERQVLRRLLPEGGLPASGAAERRTCSAATVVNARVAEWTLRAARACP